MSLIRVRFALRNAFRSIVSSGANQAAVVLILATSLGAGQALWAVWRVVVERPLPFPRSAELVELVVEESQAGRPPILFREEIRFLTETATSFVALGAWTTRRFVLGEGEATRTILVGQVDVGVLDLLGIPPASGRLFRREDHRVATDQSEAVVIGHQLWQSDLGGAPDVVGSGIILDGRRVRVIGVMPRRFAFPTHAHSAWTPAPVRAGRQEGGTLALRSATAVGRLRSGVSPRAAAAETTALVRRAGIPQRDAIRVGVRRLTERAAAPFRPALATLWFGTGLLWIVGLFGASSLGAAASLRERRTAAIRRALGASFADEVLVIAWRVVLLGTLTAATAGLMSLGISPWFRQAAAVFAAPEAESNPGMVLGGGGLLAVLAVAAVESLSYRWTQWSGRGFVLPRATARRSGPLAVGLVVLGTAASTIAGTGTALIASGAHQILRGEGAYSVENLVNLTVDFRGRGGSTASPREFAGNMLDRLVERLMRIPGVKAVGYSDRLPDREGGSFLRGESVDGNRDSRVGVRLVNATLLGTLGLPVVRGRGILTTDAWPAEPVALADRALVRRLGGVSPLGQFVGSGSARYRIVGVVPEVEVFPKGEVGAQGAIYAHFSQMGHLLASRAEIVVRLHEAPDPAMLASLARIPPATDPTIRLLEIQTAERRRAVLLGPGLLTTVAVAVFAAAGVLLSLVGIMGQIANETARKAYSLAVRAALGAPPEALRREASRDVAEAAALGIALGLVGAWLLSGLLASRMAWLETGEPGLYLVSAALMVGVVSLGCVAGVRLRRYPEPWVEMRSL